MTSYSISTTLTTDFGTAVRDVRAALAEQGFGVLTEIDIAATMKAKLGLELAPQVILGACNPPLAHRALATDASIAVLLPCNVVVRTVDEQHTLVEAMDPETMVTATGNQDLEPVAAEARTRIVAALDSLGGRT